MWKIDRRTSIKSMLFFLAAGISSFSFYKWFSVNYVSENTPIHHKKDLIAALAEVIIPRTDTPGARDAKAEDFIINIIEHCSDIRTRNNFIKGLRELEKYTDENYNKSFIVCNAAEQITIVKYFELKSVFASRFLEKVKNKLLGEGFFPILKELTIEGYCTSMTGATAGLAYDYIPVSFQACIPLTKNQRSWATK